MIGSGGIEVCLAGESLRVGFSVQCLDLASLQASRNSIDRRKTPIVMRRGGL